MINFGICVHVWNHHYHQENEYTSKFVNRLVVSYPLQLVDYSPPDSSVHGILEARIQEWVAISYSRGRCRPSLLHCRKVLYHLSHQGSPGIYISPLQSILVILCNPLEPFSIHAFWSYYFAFCHYIFVWIVWNIVQMKSCNMYAFFAWVISLRIITLGFIYIVCINHLFFLLFNHILLYRYTTICSSMLMNFLVIFHIGYYNKVMWTFMYNYLHWHRL